MIIHLLDGNLIQLDKPFALWHTIVDKNGVDIFHIREADEFVNGGIVADIVLEVGVCLAPLFGGHAKHGHVEHVSFLSILHRSLFASYFSRNEVALDGIGMYAIVDFRKFALG